MIKFWTDPQDCNKNLKAILRASRVAFFIAKGKMTIEPSMPAVLIISAIIWIFYSRTINYLLVVDDMTMYQEMKKGKKCILKDEWKRANFQGILSWVKFHLYGFGGFGVDFTNEKTQYNSIRKDHVITIIFYNVICVLMYYALGHNNIAFWATLLYAINPINHQTSVWSNGRRYAVCVILVLAMMLLPKPWGLIPWMFTSIFQVTAVFAPILLGYKYALILPLFLAFGWQYHGEYKMRLKTQMADEILHYSWKRIIVSVKLYGFYFIRSIWPGRVMMVYPHLYAWGLTPQGTKEAHKINAKFFRGVIALGLTVAGLICLHGQERLYLLFIFLATVQWCGFLGVNQHSCDRYITIPSVFTMYLVCYLAFNHLGIYALPTILFLAGLYISELNTILPMYKNIVSFHEYHNHHYPSNIISRVSMIHGCMGEKAPLGAWYQASEGLKYHPFDTRLNLLACEICLCFADKQKAQEHLNLAKMYVYEGQASFYANQFAEIQKRINAPQIYQQEARPKNKYSPNKVQSVTKDLQLASV